MKKQPYYACFSVKIGTFANRVFPPDIALYNKVEFIRLMNINQIRAKVQTLAAHKGNCVIINRYRNYAGLEGMS